MNKMGHEKLVTTDPSKEYPDFLKQVVNSITVSPAAHAPIIVKLIDRSGLEALEKLLKGHRVVSVIDQYAEQYAELLLSRNAHLYQANHAVQVSSIRDMLKKHYGNKGQWQLGSWVYYPWSGQLIHVLSQKDFEDLRTIRNRDLISETEQKKLFEFETVCFGMSVGSASALALAITGVSRRIKLVDGAVISGSNLNRILTGIESVGEDKATVISNKIYEMNPYSTVACYGAVTSSNIAGIFDKPWPLKLVVDEIDDIEMKVRIRAEAKKRHIPVVMATEIGDTIILDVERFDLEPSRPLFHGKLPGIEDLLDRKIADYREWTKHAVSIIDPSNMSLKMQESVLKIGTTIVTHPQLGSTVMMTGGMIAFAAKSIALGNPLKSGRYVISLERQLLADHQTRSYRRDHKKHTKVIRSAINSM
jgi:molybdopterin/thiamine biosynthesis adenylyltransferase